jgi:hypothetical protein
VNNSVLLYEEMSEIFVVDIFGIAQVVVMSFVIV